MDNQTLTTIAMIALMAVAFYFLILRPQRKRQAEQQKTLQALEPGARVLTSTGIYGTLVRLGERQAVIEISPGNELTVVKHAVVRVVQPGDEDLEMVGGFAAADDLDDDSDTVLEPLDREPGTGLTGRSAPHEEIVAGDRTTDRQDAEVDPEPGEPRRTDGGAGKNDTEGR